MLIAMSGQNFMAVVQSEIPMLKEMLKHSVGFLTYGDFP